MKNRPEEKLNNIRKTGNGNSRPKKSRFKIWNRRFHIFTGLYFLLFIWLFSLSGLLLNNPEWTLSNFWPDRVENSFRQDVRPPSVVGDLAIAKELMEQLAVRGEVHETGWGDSEKKFHFQVRKPGRHLTIEADFELNRADLTETRVDSRGAFRMLHTFTGAKGQTDDKRNWLLTRIWSFSMDALAAGLILMVITGLFMWLLLGRKRISGLIFLGLGTGCCLFFLFGITLFL